VVKFRYNAAGAVAALIVALGALPIAAYHVLLAPVALIPLVVAAWLWRAGTDADAGGLRVRALLGSRFIPWSWVDRFAVGQRGKVYAHSVNGTTVPLPAVRAGDLKRLVQASEPSGAASSGLRSAATREDDASDAASERAS